MMSLTQNLQMTLAELLHNIVNPDECSKVSVSGLTMDSRLVCPGDCFIAIKGLVTDGAKYISEAIDQGAVAVLVDAEIDLGCEPTAAGIPLLAIQNLSALVSEIAGRFYGNPSQRMNLVAVTGTNGKTTCCRLYAQLLAQIGRSEKRATSAFIGTTGYAIAQSNNRQSEDQLFESEQTKETGLTTPDAVSMQRILAELLDDGAQQVALEASSHSLVQYRIAGLNIDTAVFTNLSRDHLDYHKDLDSYASAKASLFAMPSVKRAVINRDDPVGRNIVASLQPSLELLTISLENTAADIYCSGMTLNTQGITASIVTPWGEGILNSSLLGQFNLTNLLTVIAVAGMQGIALQDILQAIPKLRSVPGRMEMIGGELKPVVIVDYAHTPDALEKALQALRGHCSGRLWVIFGCGGDRDSGKRAAMGEIAQRYADQVVVTSDNPRTEPPQQIVDHILQGIQGEVIVELDRRQAIASSIQSAAEEDIVLIAGKGHENYQVIGVDSFPFSDQTEARMALQKVFNSVRGESGEGAK